MLGEAGATVYCTGRSTRGNLASGPSRPETIDETAEMVTAYGGQGIAVRVDHSVPHEVEALFNRVEQEQGRLDILVNDIWGGEQLVEWKPFWERSLENGLRMLHQAIDTHIITAHYGARLMIAQKSGLIIEVTDGDNMKYRGELVYDLVKTAVIRMAHNMAKDLQDTGVTALAVTPGFLRSEEMLDGFGVSEANWRDATKIEPHFIASETPYFVGRAVAALAADPNVGKKAGGIYASWTLSDEYNFIDIDGNSPHWGRYYDEHVAHTRPADRV
jgi:NAD(P)-dependent dehydrogenase (short-subunit alcohol dehydrogenase family)